MATIQQSGQASASDGSYFVIVTELNTDTNVLYTTVTTETGKPLAQGTPESVISKLNAVKRASNTQLIDNSVSLINEQIQSLTAQNNQNNPPANSDPQADKTSNATNPNNINGTPAGDDNSYDKKEATVLANKSNLATVTGSQAGDIINKSFAGSTTAGSASASADTQVQKNVGKDPKPGTRLQNPLGNFSSYTYQLSLYMITPDAHAKFVAGGRKGINDYTKAGGGAYTLLQSAGVNTSTSQRPPGIIYDYYIDDLKIVNAVNAKETQTSSNLTNISFNIIEPLGFSLITKMKRAREELAKISSVANIAKATDPSKHFFILGIRFQGYDAFGEIANASKYFSDDTFNASPDASGVYERFYDIKLQKISFKLGPGSTVYNVQAIPIPSDIGMNVARGTVDTNMELLAATVGDALNGSGQGITSLFQTINTNQEKKKAAGEREFADVYNVRWLGTGAEGIETAILKSVINPDKKKSAASSANNSAQVNESTAVKATYDKEKVKIPITQGMPILQAISKIIKQSSFLEDALNTLFESEEEMNDETASPDKKTKKDTPALRWYNVSTEIEVLGFDTKINDFAYKITYVIQPYDTPASVSPYGRTLKYYGPHKRYQYYYTGKNTEILAFELTFDNTYYNVTFSPNGDPATSGGAASVPQLGGKPTPQDRTGYLTPGAEAQNTYVNSLFDPGAYSKAKLTILGDPDYLTRESAPGINEVYKQFYQNDGFTINPNGGQVFIEVEFNEGIDYNNENGTLSINDSIFFWNYPDSIKSEIKGLSYEVRTVESNFKSGKFTQTLTLVFNTMPNAIKAAQTTATDQRESNDGPKQAYSPARPINTERKGSIINAPTPSSTGSITSSSSGLMPEDITNLVNTSRQITNQAAEVQYQFTQNTFTSQVIPTNNSVNPIVADDDSVLNAGVTQSGISNDDGIESNRNNNQNNLLTDARKGYVG